MSSSDSELSELQEAFVDGRIKPGLNKVEEVPKQFVNNVSGIKQKLQDFKLNLPWIETLDCVSKQAPLAPELAAQMLIHEEKRENQLKNNKKLPQFDPGSDPVLNDFKRETAFHRQAQSTVMEALTKLKAMGVPTIRPDDYFAEMANSDEHMQKICTHLIRKVQSKDLEFLDRKIKSKKAIEKRKLKNKKFGYGGKKKGSKLNTKESAADISEYRRLPDFHNSGAGHLCTYLKYIHTIPIWS